MRKNYTWILPRRIARALCVFMSVLFVLHCDGLFAFAAPKPEVSLPMPAIPPDGFGVAPLPFAPPAARPALPSTDWNDGDVIVAVDNVGYKVYDNVGALKETVSDGLPGIFRTGMAFDARGDLWGTNFSDSIVSRFDQQHPHQALQRIDVTDHGGGNCESIVFARNGDFYVANSFAAQPVGRLQRYNAGGVFLRGFVPDFERGAGFRVSTVDWIDLSVDQKTMFYTSEGGRILRYDVEADRQLSDFSSVPLPRPQFDAHFALRLLPPGDGRGGLLVAATQNILGLDGVGDIVKTYDAPGEDNWFALTLDPNGTSFWAAGQSSKNFYRFNIATRQIEVGPISAGNPVGGIVVKGGPQAGVNTPPVVVCPNPQTAPAGTPVTLVAAASDRDCNVLRLSWSVDGGRVELVDTLPAGALTVSGSSAFTRTYRPGVHAVKVAVSDGFAETVCETTVTIEGDVTPPVVGCTVAASSLTPGNHKLVDVGLQVTVADETDLAPAIAVKVFSDEPGEDRTGDGNREPDAEVVGTGGPGGVTLKLRAERKGDGDGRVYLIIVTARDASGNASTACCTVVVPHDQSKASQDAVAAQARAAEAGCGPNGSPATPFLVSEPTPVAPAVAPAALPPTLTALSVFPEAANILEGTTLGYAAIGTFSDNSARDLTGSVTWASAATSTATIDAAGLAEAKAGGSTTITASLNDLSAVGGLTVIPRTLVHVKLDPLHDGSKVAGQSRRYIATGFFNDCSVEDISGTATWTSSNAAVATIDATGLAVSVAAGQTTITATQAGLSASTLFEVIPRVIVRINVTAPSTAVLAIGESRQLTAIATFNDGTTQDVTATATWSISTPSIATINATGFVTGLSTGGTNVLAQQGGVTGFGSVSVQPLTLSSITVTPADATIAVGTVRQYMATGNFNNGTTQDLTAAATWESTAPATATINSAGLATAVVPGFTTIKASKDGKVGSTGLVVQGRALIQIVVNPFQAQIRGDETLQYEATGVYNDGTTSNLTATAFWSSTLPAAATIAPGGLATGRAQGGTTTIKAQSGAIVGNATLTVLPTALLSITVSPAEAQVPVGATVAYDAFGSFADGSVQDITSTVTWSVTNTFVATISPSGTATTLATGTALVKAEKAGAVGFASVTVFPTLSTITILPAGADLPVDGTRRYTATGTFTDATTLDLTGSVTWSTGDSGKATIDATGLATGVAVGVTTVQATLLSVSGLTTVNVVPENPPPFLEITAPGELGEIKGLTHVTGTVQDTDLAGFTVELLRQGVPGVTVIGSGSASVVGGTLGTIDPTLLENDFYEVRVTATDAAGQTVVAVVPVTIVGNQKVGIFSLTFTDLSVPVQGIPITITRTYDTRLLADRDFGLGWRLDVVAGNLKKRSNHDVMVTLPDNRRTLFNFTPTGTYDDLNAFAEAHPALGLCPLFSRDREAAYTPEAHAPGWTLRSLGDQDLLAVPTRTEACPTVIGEDVVSVPVVTRFDVFYFDLTPYAPPGYVVSDQRGMEYEYDAAGGGRLVQIREPNGNFLNVTDTAVTHSTGKAISITRNPSTGRILKITDPDGKEVNYQYPAPGDPLSTSIDREGNQTEYLYNLQGKLRDIKDPRGIQAVRNEYDAGGRLVAHVDADGNRIEFTHDVAGRQEVVRDRRGNLTVYVYDEDGDVLAQANALGGTRTFEYDGAGNEILMRDELGNGTHSTYDGRGNLLSRTDPLTHVTLFEYDVRGLVTKTTVFLSLFDARVTQNFYDVDGNLLKTRDALNNETFHSYDGLGRLIATVDPLGTRTEFDHNLFGYVTEQRVISSTMVLLRKTTFTYDGNGRNLTQTSWKKAAGVFAPFAATTTVYNANGQAIEVRDPEGRSSFTAYNAVGRQSAVTDKNGNTTIFQYDDRGLLSGTLFPSILVGGMPVTPVEEVAYDVEGNRVSFTDRNGNISRTEYDKLNRPFKVIHPDSTFRVTTYDAAGRVVGETDERGISTTFEYDNAGRRIKVIDPLLNETRFTLNAVGEQTQVVDALNHTTSFQYDGMGRQTRISFPDATFRLTEYDRLGRRKAEVDEAGIRQEFVYAPTGELIEVRQPDPGNTSMLTTVTRFEYDDLGRKVTQIDALGRATGFSYNTRNELVQRKRPMTETESFTYDFQGNLKTRTDGIGNVTSFSYNALNLLAGKDFPTGLDQAFGYFPGGQRKSFTVGTETTTFTLDIRNRLASQTNPDGSVLSWGYDAAGNRTRVQTPALTVDYTWTARNELFEVLKEGVRHGGYAYDKVGNRKSVAYENGTTQDLTYNARNRLTLVENKAGATVISS